MVMKSSSFTSALSISTSSSSLMRSKSRVTQIRVTRLKTQVPRDQSREFSVIEVTSSQRSMLSNLHLHLHISR
ncbi:hypothetical protein L484_017540 [Morus notabilis]|uniref:Uncharacterized protein n=1 Tax=Morus notabilis TaxID=981085 RepID=W9QTN3_9ROSA|nr:hypothetical protein L484_017540 [Morus notabilis]